MISLSWIVMKSDSVFSANKHMFILTLKKKFSSIHKNENHSYPTYFLLLNVQQRYIIVGKNDITSLQIMLLSIC